MVTETDFMLPRDKANHAIYGGAAFIVLLFAGHWLTWLTPGAAMAGVVIVGAAKEGWDWWRNRRQLHLGQAPTHDPSWFDFLATVGGGVAAFVITALD